MTGPKVAFFLPHLTGGGAERICVNLATDFRKRGLDVDFVLARAEGPLLAEIPSGARLVDLHVNRTILALPGLVRYLRREHPYAIIASHDHANLIPVWAKILSGSRARVIIRAANHLSVVRARTPKLQEKVYPVLLRIFHRRVDGIIAVSNGVADDMARVTGILRNRIRVIHNPSVRPEIDPLSKAPLDHDWFAPGQPPVILAVGRLAVQKDYPTLLRAFARLRGRRPARLFILGEGDQYNALTKMISEMGIGKDVELGGFDINPYRFMARCAVFVLSSAWEGFPNVIAEALACGAQVVSTNCPSGAAEILENGKFGALVPVGDDAGLADAIENALEHPLPPAMLRERAQAFSVHFASAGYLRAMGLESA